MKTQLIVCKKCNIPKPIDEFYRHKGCRFGVWETCKICLRERDRQRRRDNPERHKKRCDEWKAKNPEKIKEWKKNNLVKCREYNKEWLKNNPEKVKVYTKRRKEWRENNRAKCREYDRRRRRENPEKTKEIATNSYRKRRKNPAFKLNMNISSAIRISLKGNKNGYHWEDVVGYSLGDLKRHLKKRFVKGMMWKNYGSAWHIDHIIPVSVFNFTKPEHADFKRCWGLDNLRPLWASDNFSKGNKLKKHFQPALLL